MGLGLCHVSNLLYKKWFVTFVAAQARNLLSECLSVRLSVTLVSKRLNGSRYRYTSQHYSLRRDVPNLNFCNTELPPANGGNSVTGPAGARVPAGKAVLRRMKWATINWS